MCRCRVSMKRSMMKTYKNRKMVMSLRWINNNNHTSPTTTTNYNKTSTNNKLITTTTTPT